MLEDYIPRIKPQLVLDILQRVLRQSTVGVELSANLSEFHIIEKNADNQFTPESRRREYNDGFTSLL